MSSADRRQCCAFVLFAFVVAAGVGCGPVVTIQANRAGDFSGRLEPLQVLVNQGSIDMFYADELTKAMRQELSRQGVQHGVDVLTGLEIDLDARLEQLEATSNGILLITPIGGSSYYGKLKQIVYDMRLFARVPTDPSNEMQLVWRARVDTSSGGYDVQIIQRMQLTAQRLVGRLKQEGFL